MNKPLFLIRISSERVTCLGSELVDILNIVYPLVKSYVWYGADVEISGELPFKWALEKNFPEKIGGFDAVIQIGRNTNQFLSGVFFALDKDFGKIWNRQFFTDDDAFRDIEEAVLEIRAFDTSYFEIYSSDYTIIKTLSDHFHVVIQKHG